MKDHIIVWYEQKDSKKVQCVTKYYTKVQYIEKDYTNALYIEVSTYKRILQRFSINRDHKIIVYI